MKLIAYYLPQFHEVPENNKWWGEGFTEWTNVKGAKRLYKNHVQPKEPKNDNYYDLTEKKVVEWQTKLAKENSIYGFCYYHYWFNGRLILEKPAENLLSWKNIPQNFCFCWANHSWKKTWNGLNQILIDQTYGDEEEWEKHLNYLLPFFKDERYIKIDNKPVFLFYSTRDIPSVDKRIKYYNTKCIEAGFDGIYIIESLNSKNSKIISDFSDGGVLREPAISMSCLPMFNKITKMIKSRFRYNLFWFVSRYKYKDITNISIDFAKKFDESNKKVFLGAFSGWDSTSRHGRRGYVIEENSIELFEEYLFQLIEISEQKGNEYLFINAWNEWAEGMYLEPDKFSNDLFLKTILKIMRK